MSNTGFKTISRIFLGFTIILTFSFLFLLFEQLKYSLLKSIILIIGLVIFVPSLFLICYIIGASGEILFDKIDTRIFLLKEWKEKRKRKE